MNIDHLESIRSDLYRVSVKIQLLETFINSTITMQKKNKPAVDPWCAAEIKKDLNIIKAMMEGIRNE